MSARGAAALSGGALVLVYLATLAPSVTLWDSGEFLAAVATLGVPHPPATPLFVFGARAWATVLGAFPLAYAVNLASAIATAVAAGGLAWLIARWTRAPWAGALGAAVGGTMAAVWQSATETEVYAHAAMAVVLTLVVADHAGRAWSVRHRLLVAFLFGLAVPLHISVLVAGPAVILLAATDRGGHVSVRAALPLAAAWLLAVGIGTVAWPPLLLAALLALANAMMPAAPVERGVAGRGAEGTIAMLLALLGVTFVLVLLVRAGHDPGINEGDPRRLSALVDVVARRQYDVPPLWPRRAPFWLQLGNVVQYADWQVASSLSDAPGPSVWRTSATVLMVALGLVGARWHRSRDVRSWRVMTLLLLCATVGVVTVLNLRAGPSFGVGVLPPGALREARERDYFFALAFLVGGVWCGCGVAVLAGLVRGEEAPAGEARTRRWPLRRAIAALAAVPLALNWMAVDRSRFPESQLATAIGEGLLFGLPRDAVLVLAGDNDSFPVWFAQRVSGVRPDVTPVTIPLLGARWYRDELRRRHALLSVGVAERWQGLHETLAALGAGAASRGRPIAVAVSVPADQRTPLDASSGWRLAGLWYRGEGRASDAPHPAIDTLAARTVDAWIRRRFTSLVLESRGREPAGRYVQRLLACPSQALALPARAELLRELETWCNYR